MEKSQKILCYDMNGDAHIVKKSDLVKRQSVYGVLIKEEGILLVNSKHRKEEQWELPGGGIDQDEDITQALRREFKEETGLEIINAPQKICDFTEYYYELKSEKAWESTRHFYKVEANGEISIDGNDYDVTEARHSKDHLSKGIVPVTREVISLAIKKEPTV